MVCGEIREERRRSLPYSREQRGQEERKRLQQPQQRGAQKDRMSDPFYADAIERAE